MRIAVLGCGSIGVRHLQNLRRLGWAEVTGFDPSSAIRTAVTAELGVECLGELDQVWAKRPQAVLIASPTNLHLDLAIEAAQQGCHLFIEKPLSHGLEGVNELLAQIESRALTTMVACNMRFHAGPATIKRLIESRAIGSVISIRVQTGSYLPMWRPSQDYRQSYSASAKWGGAILDCIHELDLALWYGGPATLICAAKSKATSLGLDTDGLAEILLRHDSGVISSVHLNFVQRDYRRTCQIIGTEGTIYWDFESKDVVVYDHAGRPAKHFAEPARWETNQMYLDELSHFLISVERKTPTVNSVADALAPLQIALMARDYSAN